MQIETVRASYQTLLGNRNILIVDDEESIRRLLGYLLEPHGYAISLAADAREARQQLAKTGPDVDIVDRLAAEIGYRILVGSDAELLKVAALIAWTHHERWDGSGYPRKLKGEAIPLEGRIAAVADAFDALTTERVYKPAFPFEHAVELMTKHRGEHYDPDLLDVFVASIEDIKSIHDQYADHSFKAPTG